jgi:hypothetical protein
MISVKTVYLTTAGVWLLTETCLNLIACRRHADNVTRVFTNTGVTAR